MTLRLLHVVLSFAVLWGANGNGQSQAEPAASEVKPLRIVGLRYPRLALLSAVQGRVELEAVVSADGKVKDVKSISGHPLLVNDAKDSLRQWRFTACAPSATQCSARAIFVFEFEKGACEIDSCPNDIQVDMPANVTIRSKPARAIIN
jgi:TonB family protein